MTVADRIKMRRLELEWSQEELAKRAGYYGKPTISKYENAGNDISMKQVSRIAKALGVTTAYLMGWETTADQVTQENKPDGYYISTDDFQKAVELYMQYEKLTPENQVAFENYLKFLQSGS